MTRTAQEVTSFKFARDVLVKEGSALVDKFTQTNHLFGRITMIKIERATCIHCHTARTSQALTTTQLLGVNDSAVFEFGSICIGTPFAVGFQSMTPAT